MSKCQTRTFGNFGWYDLRWATNKRQNATVWMLA